MDVETVALRIPMLSGWRNWCVGVILSERNIGPFVMGRKNLQFANTVGGAQASAVIYSLIETAKKTDLDPHQYLLWVL